MRSSSLTLGVLSDTHGLLRPEALAALRGCDRILHAGDVGGPEVLEGLARIAPVEAVRGNNDHGAWAEALPELARLDLAGRRFLLLHDLHELTRHGLDPRAEGIDVVVAGHSHRPSLRQEQGVLWLNPGSAGPRRFRLPIALARVELTPGGCDARILRLDEPQSAPG